MEKTVIQNISAPVYGHVVAGNMTMEHYAHEITWRDLSTDVLENRLRKEQAARWRSIWRYWVNPPCALMLLYCIGLLAWMLRVLLTGQFFKTGFVPLGFSPLWLMAVNTGFMIPVFYWLGKIRRVEVNAARHANENIEAIENVLWHRQH